MGRRITINSLLVNIQWKNVKRCVQSKWYVQCTVYSTQELCGSMSLETKNGRSELVIMSICSA